MSRPATAAAVAITAAVLPLCAGCDVQGRIQVRADQSAAVDLTIWDQMADSSQTATHCSLDQLPQLTSAAVPDPNGDPHRVGCHITGDLSPAEAAAAGSAVVMAADHRIAVFPGAGLPQQLAWTTADWASAPAGTTPTVPAHPGVFDVTIEMPGPIIDHQGNAQVAGNTAHFTTPPAADQPVAVTSLDGTIFPSTLVLGATAALGLLTGLAGALTYRTLRPRGGTPTSEPTTKPTTTVAADQPTLDTRIWSREPPAPEEWDRQHSNTVDADRWQRQDPPPST